MSFPPPTSSAALLVLADGSRFLGHAIGASGRTVGGLVFITALLIPMLELLMFLLVLVPLRLGRVSPRLATFFRLVRSVQPWGMVEVFLLGMLVSLVKLSHLATVVLGTAFWATAALIVVLTLAARAFDTRLLWQPPMPELAR